MALTRKQRELLNEAKKNPYVRSALDMIMAAEGTGDYGNDGYYTNFGGSQLKDLTTHPKQDAEYTNLKGQRRSANDAGRYQISGSTFDSLSKKLGKTDFSPDTQDEMAILLFMEKGALEPIMRGDIQSGINKLGNTWYSLPSSTKQQYVPSRSKDFVMEAYNKALLHHTHNTDIPTSPNGVVTEAPSVAVKDLKPSTIDIPATPPQYLPPRRGSNTTPTMGQSGAINVREALNRRYVQPRLAVMEGKLTPENNMALTDALFNPTSQTPITPYPTYGIEGPQLVQQYTQTPIAAAPSTPPSGDSLRGPLQIDPNVQQGLILTHSPDIQQPSTQTLSYDRPMEDSTIPTQPLSYSPQAQLQEEFDRAIEGILLGDNSQEDTAMVLTPEEQANQYLMEQLQTTRTARNGYDFLGLNALDMPYRDEILAMIDATPVTIG